MKINQLIPELLVEDLSKSLQFYRTILKFKSEIVFPKKNPVFAQVGRDGIHIMLYERCEFEQEIPRLKKIKMGGTILIYIKAKGIKKFYEQIKGKVNIVQPLHETNYGVLEYTIEDCNGYLIAFSQPVATK